MTCDAEGAPRQEIALGGGVVHSWQIDQFGHMNVRWYAHLFDDSSFLFWKVRGLCQQKMISEFGVHTVTIRATTEFSAELRAGDCTCIFGDVLKIGTKSVILRFRLVDIETGKLYATYETVEVFVDEKLRCSTEIPGEIRQLLDHDTSGD